MNVNRESLLLYAVTDRRWLHGETLYEQVEKAILGGVTFVQLREKELSEEAFIEEAVEIGKLCRTYGVPFVINDNVRVAVASDADGVHLGQGDMQADEARRILGSDKIIGVTARTVEQALLAEANGADYLGVGAVFSTSSKGDAAEISHEKFSEICRTVKIPVIAIGGITEETVRQLSGRGACGIAAISAIFGQKEIREAAASLKKAVKEMVCEK